MYELHVYRMHMISLLEFNLLTHWVESNEDIHPRIGIQKYNTD